jgi:uncharacterized membrane protein
MWYDYFILAVGLIGFVYYLVYRILFERDHDNEEVKYNTLFREYTTIMLVIFFAVFIDEFMKVFLS